MIQWFGRWASDAVKGYVEEAWTELAGHWGFGSPGSAVEPPPASGTPSTVAAPAAQVKAGPAPPADGAQARLEWGEVRSRLEALASVDGRLQDLDQAFARMQARLAKWEAGGEPGGKDGNEEARVEAADDGLPVELAEAAVPAQLAALREEVQRLADAIAKEREERAALEDQMPQEALQLGARGEEEVKQRYVHIPDTRCYHVERSGWATQHPVHWRTVCGLEHGSVALAHRALRVSAVPPGIPLGRKGGPRGATTRSAKCFDPDEPPAEHPEDESAEPSEMEDE
jgi:hypothetical protein